eukprot:11186048-Karenia_brevis.AAC.1
MGFGLIPQTSKERFCTTVTQGDISIRGPGQGRTFTFVQFIQIPSLPLESIATRSNHFGSNTVVDAAELLGCNGQQFTTQTI